MNGRQDNPYPGARPLRYGEPLHGRQREVAELRDLVIARRIVLLYSPSGAGKSSLVGAGLQPELEQRSLRVLPTIRVGLGDAGGSRNRYVLSTLLSLEEGRDRALDPARLDDLTLDDYLRLVTEDTPDGRDPCLVFDQFEELFTLDPTDVDEKAAFLRELGVALRDRSRSALFAMREDFIAALDPFLGLLPTRLTSRYRLDLLGPAAATAAAVRPAAAAGVVFEDEAAQRLIDDLRAVRVLRGTEVRRELGPHVEPVQLQVTCRRLWERLAPTDDRIDLEDVEALGDVDLALGDFYDAAVRAAASRTGVHERDIRAWVDHELITDSGFRSQTSAGPGTAGPEVLRELEDAHVVRSERRRGIPWYELSHDRLLAPVRERNDAWRAQHLSPLQRAAQAWRQQGRTPGMELTGAALDEAVAWAEAHPGEVSPLDREFLDASRKEADRLALEHQVARRNRLIAITAVVIGLLAVAGLVVALVLRSDAVEARQQAESSERAAVSAEGRATDALDRLERTSAGDAWRRAATDATDPRTRALAARAAAGFVDGPLSPELRRQLTTAEHYLRHDPVHAARDAALDADGRTLARAALDGGVELVDVDTLERTWLDREVQADQVAFHPTDGRLAVRSGTTITVWDSATGERLGEMTLPAVGDDAQVELALGGDLIAAAVGRDVGGAASERSSPVLLWDSRSGASVTAPVGAAGDRVALDPEGTILAVAAAWDAQQPEDEQLQVWRRTGTTWEPLLAPRPVALPSTGAFAVSGGLVLLGVDPVGAGATLEVVDVTGGGRDLTWLEVGEATITAATARADGTLRFAAQSGVVTTTTIEALLALGPDGALGGQTGQWTRGHERARFSGDGERLVVTAGQPPLHTVWADGEGDVLGRDVAFAGTTAGGRSLVRRYDGASFQAGQHVTDERPIGATAWERDRWPAANEAIGPDGTLALLARDGTVAVDGGGSRPTCQPVSAGAPDQVELGWYVPMAASAGAATIVGGPDRTLEDFLRERICVMSAAGAETIALLPEENLRAIAVSPDGGFLAAGTRFLGAGSAVVYRTDSLAVHELRLPAPVTAVALAEGASLVAAGDESGTVSIGEPASGRTCESSLPRREEVRALSLGTGRDGTPLLAAATPTGVHVLTIDAATLCTEEIGGLDLFRVEGTVLDVEVRPDGTVAVLESDRFEFGFDPLRDASELGAAVDELLDARGWALDAGECQALVARTCP